MTLVTVIEKNTRKVRNLDAIPNFIAQDGEIRNIDSAFAHHN